MAKGKTIRSKSIIMFTDIVGYSQIVSKDEKRALELLDEHNDIIFPIIKNHDGEIIKLIGDAIFARYLSSKASLLSAIEIQNKLKDRNDINKNNEAIKIRIGLHRGKVIEKDDDLFGHDVNLCSRIESVTQSGSITISEEIFQSVINIDSLFHRKIGHVKLKNIPEPKILYKTYLDLLDYNKENDETLYNSFIERGIEVVDFNRYKTEQIVSLGVLYFTNLGKESDEYFCYNFTKDLIDNLQSVNSLRVPSINEISKFKNIELSKSDIARKLEVNKVIQGSILISDDKASMNLEFVDIDNGEILWNTALKIDLKKTLHIHNQVIDKILELVGIDIPDHIKKKFIIQSTDNPDAEREYKKARYLINIQNKKEDLLIADKHLNKAIKYDPKYLFAHTQKAIIATKVGEYERAEELLNFALDIAKQDGSSISNGYVYSILGYFYNSWSKNNHALKYNKLALKVYNHLDRPIPKSNILHNLGISLLHLGKLDDALSYFKKSLKIKQKYEDRLLQGSSYAEIGNLYLTKYNYTESIFYLNRSLAIYKDFDQSFNKGLSMIFISEAYIETGQIEKATELIKEAEIILDEYKDPTIQGRLNNYKGIIAFYSSDMGRAIAHIQNSIQQYQSAQKLVPAFKGHLILLQFHIYNNQFHKAKVILKEIETLERQIKDNKFIIRYASINYLINTLKNQSGRDTGLKIIQQLSFAERDVDHYLSFWYLALAFSMLDKKNKAQKNLLQSQKLLKERSEKDSDKKKRELILYTNPINRQIIDLDVESLKDYADSLIKEYDTVKVSKFCPECGYSNIDLKSSCPECNNNLKI